jgi:hypothetical protein
MAPINHATSMLKLVKGHKEVRGHMRARAHAREQNKKLPPPDFLRAPQESATQRVLVSPTPSAHPAPPVVHTHGE